MNQDLLNLLKQRRSIYALGKDIKQNPDELVALIESVIQETPTAFNSQLLGPFSCLASNMISYGTLWSSA